MNLTKNTLLALVALTATTAGFAQTASTETVPTGVLGQSYSEARFGMSDIKSYSKNQYGLGLAGNMPVTSFLDVGAGYDYGWIRGEGHFNLASANVVAYTTVGGVKPFVGALVGYEWVSYAGGKENMAVWGAAAGVEFSLGGGLSLTPRAVFSSDFRSSNRSSQSSAYELEANYWVSKTAAVFASVGSSEVNGSDDRSTDFTVGARFKF